jgi:hypothetical protein
MKTCPECGEEFPEPMLVRHREFVHPEEFAAEGSAAAEQARAERDETELRFTPDGFLRRRGPKPEAPTDPATTLGGMFPSDPGVALPPWQREEQARRGP